MRKLSTWSAPMRKRSAVGAVVRPSGEREDQIQDVRLVPERQ